MKSVIICKIRNTGVILLIAIMFSTVLQSFAIYQVDADTYTNGAIILANNSKVRIAECVEGQYVFRAEYNKDSKKMSVTKVGLLNKEICSVTWINLGSSPVLASARIDQRTNRLAASIYTQSTYENTFSDYEYTKWYGSPNKWELRRPATKGAGTQGFKTYQTTKNSNSLKGFYSTVNKINQRELSLIGLVGITALIGVVGSICTGGLAAFLAAAGFTVTATAEAVSLQSAIKAAKDFYWEAYYSSVRF